MRTTRRRITQSRGAQCVAGATFLFAIALLIPGVTQRFNTAVTWRPAGPFFSPAGQVKFDHSANATTEATPAEEAIAADGDGEGGQGEQQIDLTAMSEDQLAEALSWWQSSQKIDNPPGDPLYPPPERESYITWEPDIGGLNNIRMQMEMLVILTHLTGRTLVLPDHLAGDIYMMRQPVSLWDFYDFEHLRQWIPAISMDQYLNNRNVAGDDAIRTDANALRDYLRDGGRHTETAYPKWNAVTQVIAPGGDGTGQDDPTGAHPRLEEWRIMHANPDEKREEVFYGDEERGALTLHFESSDQTRLFGSPAFIYLPTAAWLDYYWSKVRDYLHFQPDRVRQAARVLVRVVQETGGNFNAMHVRSTDWAMQYPEWFIEPENAAPKAVQVLGGEMAVYIATDDDNRTALEPLIKAFPQVIFMSDMVSEEDVPYNARGVVDQMVCSVAGRFLGTFGSTFSAYISRLRAYHSTALVPDKGVYFTNYPETPDAYGNAINNNEWQAGAVWWSRPGVEHFNRELWMRDFVVATDFPTLRLSLLEGQPVEEGQEGQPAEGQLAEGQEAQLAEGGDPQQPAPEGEEQPAEGGQEGQPAEGQEGQPQPEGQQQEVQSQGDQIAEGQPVEGQEGQPQPEGQSQEGQPQEEQPAEGQEAQPQAESQAVEGQEGQPQEGQEGQPQEGQAVEGQEGQPQEGQPAEGQEGQPQPEGQGQPAEGGGQEGQPVGEQPAEGQQNAEGKPAEEQQIPDGQAQPEGEQPNPEAQPQNPEGGEPQPDATQVEGQEGQQNPEGQNPEGQPAQARRMRLSRALRSFLSL